MKHLQIIRNTHNPHTCLFCNRGIPAKEEAIAMVEETKVEEHDVKHIDYYCSMECYNEQEVRDYRTEKARHEMAENAQEE